MGTIVIAAPAGATRERLLRFFGQRATPISLDREAVIAEGRLLIADQTVRLGDQELIEGVDAAIVLDSGYMWPLPKLEPSIEEWEAARNDFDELLRDDRETESLWYSALAILEDRLPFCANRSGAFAMEAMKPFAFLALQEGGVAVPPFLATNDPVELARFADEHGGELRRLPLLPDEASEWLEAGALAELREPTLVQSVTGREPLRLMVVGREVIPIEPASPLPDEVTSVALTACDLLDLALGELLFLPGSEGPLLADFTPSPDLGLLRQATAERVMDAIWRLILGASARAT
jgi:hypothetical protein